MATILVSHDFGVIAQACDTVAVMYAGYIVERGPVRESTRMRSIPTRWGWWIRSPTSIPPAHRTTT